MAPYERLPCTFDAVHERPVVARHYRNVTQTASSNVGNSRAEPVLVEDLIDRTYPCLLVVRSGGCF